MTRDGRSRPTDNRTANQPTDAGTPTTVHRPGTFPATGHDVAYSIEEGEALAGRVQARLTWDTAASPHDIVIHLGAFLVDTDSKVPAGNPFYCLNHDNDRSKDGSTVRHGRRRHGHNVHDETITVDLDLVDPDVEKVVFVAYIQDANPLNHTFSGLVGGCVAFYQLTPDDRDPQDDPSLKSFNQHLLDADYYDGETAVVMGEVFRETVGTWGYRDIGMGLPGLIEVGAQYGVMFVAGR